MLAADVTCCKGSSFVSFMNFALKATENRKEHTTCMAVLEPKSSKMLLEDEFKLSFYSINVKITLLIIILLTCLIMNPASPFDLGSRPPPVKLDTGSDALCVADVIASSSAVKATVKREAVPALNPTKRFKQDEPQ